VTGDFLFVKAFQLGGTFDRNVVELTADACAKLAEGEILQNRYRHRTDLSVDTYLKIMERKTAYPIKAGAMVGAYLAHASEDVVQSIGRYGLDLGIEFQIIDDVLDFVGDRDKTGKVGGMDLKEGHLTLPSLLAMKDSASSKEAILEVISSEQPGAEQIKKCVELIIASGSISKSKNMAEYYGIEALGHLGCMPKNQETQMLRDIVKKVLERDS
jgi:geranylgeranyl pyrophosphate synthase